MRRFIGLWPEGPQSASPYVDGSTRDAPRVRRVASNLAATSCRIFVSIRIVRVRI